MHKPEWHAWFQHVPPANDPRWPGWTAGLLAFMARPRDWVAIRAWGVEQGFSFMGTRQLVAWLALNDLISFSDRSRTWRAND